MSNLTIKQFDWKFEDTDFYWNPKNREFSAFMNSISFLVVGLERYFCRAIRDAEALITDPVVLEEAKMFNQQEMAHSKAHYKHCQALIAKYPALQDALDGSIRMFDEVYEAQDLKYHLSYAGGLESIFTPFFGTIIDHRDLLFGGGDPEVASLFLWHFCEEIEHRSAAITIYNHVYGDHLYRIRNIKPLMAHGREVIMMLQDVFKRAVPDFDTPEFFVTGLNTIPRFRKMRMSLGIFASQMPWFNHEKQRLPAYYAEWNQRYQNGEDMRVTYGGQPSAA